jgi:hypothetical protein
MEEFPTRNQGPESITFSNPSSEIDGGDNHEVNSRVMMPRLVHSTADFEPGGVMHYL